MDYDVVNPTDIITDVNASLINLKFVEGPTKKRNRGEDIWVCTYGIDEGTDNTKEIFAAVITPPGSLDTKFALNLMK